MTTRTGHFWELWILCLGNFSLWSHSIVWCCKNNNVYTDQLYNIDTQFAEKHKLDYRSFFSAHYQQKLLSKYQKNQLYQSCAMEISLINKSNTQSSQLIFKAINQYCPKALLVISKILDFGTHFKFHSGLQHFLPIIWSRGKVISLDHQDSSTYHLVLTDCSLNFGH